MAAYGFLVSLMNTINDIQHHPNPPISLDEYQIESLTEMANFFKDFLRTYNPHSIYTQEADPLEDRIATAAYAAEDAIDLSIQNHSFEVARLALFEDLQRVIHEMGSIKKEALEITQRGGVLHPQILQLHSHSMTKSSASSGSSSVQQNTAMVGIEKVTDELLEKIIGYTFHQVIPITGMGGIGKTTLATHVYQHKTMVHHFDILAWATISQDFSMKETLLKLHQPLLKHHNEKLSENELKGKLSKMSEDELQLKLHQILSNRRYLIVLDDIWDIEVWNKLQLYFPNNNNGSRIVVTTRQSKLAHDVCGSEYPSRGIEMRFLDEDTSWGLFCKIVFKREDFPPELKGMERIGRKIVASCKGLPLSINVIGGLLRASARTPQYWEYVAGNLNSIVNSEDNEHCLKILYSSYNNLPVYLKPCFMYMGVFEEDMVISVSLLIQLWLADGLVETESGKSLEEVAEEWVTELVDRNLLAGKLGRLGRLESCKVHDLLRDFCLREARKHNALVEVFHDKQALIQDLYIPFESKRWDRPLFRKRLWRVYSINPFARHDLDFVYQRLNIRLLVAKYTRGPNHKPVISFSSISPCWNLHTLHVQGFPSEHFFLRIWNMSQLRHVESQMPFVLLHPLADDFVLKNLQTLSKVKNMTFHDGVIKRLPNIKKLRVQYYGDKHGVHDYCLNNVCNLHKLRFFSLKASIWNPYLEVQNMTFPQSLEELRLRGTQLQWKDMTQKLGSLPLLQVLTVDYLACAGREWHTAEGQFASLKILDIRDIELKYWETDSSHFPRLEHLLLSGLKKLKEVPSSIGDISTLQSITLSFCSDSANDSAKRIREEQENAGNCDLQVRIEEDKNRIRENVIQKLQEVMPDKKKLKELVEKLEPLISGLFSRMNLSREFVKEEEIQEQDKEQGKKLETMMAGLFIQKRKKKYKCRGRSNRIR